MEGDCCNEGDIEWDWKRDDAIDGAGFLGDIDDGGKRNDELDRAGLVNWWCVDVKDVEDSMNIPKHNTILKHR